MVEALRSVVFPDYFSTSNMMLESMNFHIGSTRDWIQWTMKDQINRGLCFVCHEGNILHATTQSSFFRDPEQQDYQIFAAPLRNNEECRSCHSESGPKLGIVLVRQNLDPINQQVRAVQIGLGIVGGIAIVVTMLITRLLLGRYLGRPLKSLVAGAKAIGAGHLEHKIELSEPSELALLANTLNTSTARLSDLQGELVERERLAAVGETVTGLAHSLKNMLNGLRAGQYVIDRGINKQDTEKLRTGWRIMKNSIRHVEGLVIDMLYYSKDRVPERKHINMNAVILDIVEALREMAVGQGVEIRVDLDEAMSEELLDGTAIHRLIIDLVTNAVDACTESETGSLVIVKTRVSPKEIVLTVKDDGIGMSDAVRENLFTRLFSTKAAKGTGLGMPVINKLTKEHDGTINVESIPGKGSAFHIHFPRSSNAGSHVQSDDDA